MKAIRIMVLLAALAVGFSAQALTLAVKDVKMAQRYPWNGLVDIDYTIECDDANADVYVYPVGYDRDFNNSVPPRSLTGDGANGQPVKPGSHRMTWDMATDMGANYNRAAFSMKLHAYAGAAPYMVIDLSGGSSAEKYAVSHLREIPEGGWGTEYKTSKLVLKLIAPGNFMMGEKGGSDYHKVTLTQPFYMAVFETTQFQFQSIYGSNPSSSQCDNEPVRCVSYNTLRGSTLGANWPTHNQVDATSFFGKLRSRTGIVFDLPTEAQWEYACRAGTDSTYNGGSTYDIYQLGQCSGNPHMLQYGFGPIEGGCYIPNSWGLYDMHGNIGEWCLDWYGSYPASDTVDPIGSPSGSYRVIRGGSYIEGSDSCTSYYRNYEAPSDNGFGIYGFRLCCSAVAEDGIDLGGFVLAESEMTPFVRLENRPAPALGRALVCGTEQKSAGSDAVAVAWDTTAAADGWHTFAAEGAPETTADVLVRNGAAFAVEGGRLAADATWGDNAVHLVRNWVIVPSGVTLTVTSNTVVKFCEQTGVLVEKGGRFLVQGSRESTVVFTSSADDTVGGDSDELKGVASNDLYTITVNTGGTFADTGATFRYASIAAHATVSVPGACDVFEKDGSVQIPVSLSGSRATPFRVFWRAVDETAVYPDDYTVKTGIVEWASSSVGTKYITIPVLNDSEQEKTETFTVELYDAQGANLSRTAFCCTVTIRDSTPIEVPMPTCAESEASPFVRLENRPAGTLGRALACGTEFRSPGPDAAATAWDTTALAEGWHTFAADDAPSVTADLLVRNEPDVVGGRLSSDLVWDASRVRIVRNWVIVPWGVTLTVTTNAVVKFCEGTGIRVEAGGAFRVVGSVENPAVFAAVSDDTVGGDSDGRVCAVTNDLYSITVAANGIFEDSGATFRQTAVAAHATVSVPGACDVFEGDGSVRIPVTLSGSRASPFRVFWRAVDGTAVCPDDYVAQTGVVEWASSSVGTKYITIPVLNDGVLEDSETFTVELYDAQGANLSRTANRCTVTIRDWTPIEVPTPTCAESEASPFVRLENRPAGTLGRALASGTEQKSAGPDAVAAAWDTTSAADGWHTFAAEGAPETTADVLVRNGAAYAVEGGRLAADETWESNAVHLVRNWVIVPSGVTLTVTSNTVVKFCEKTGVLVENGGRFLVQGSRESTVVFTSFADDTVGGDSDELKGVASNDLYTITVNTGGTFADTGATFRYASIAAHATVSLPGSFEISESNERVQIPVSLSGSRATPFRVFWRAVDGTAVYPDDYTLQSGVIEWTSSSAGTKYITIPVLNDSEQEKTETFTVELYDAQGANLSRTAFRCTVTIRDSTPTVVPTPTCAESEATPFVRLENRPAGTLGRALAYGTEQKSAGPDAVAAAWDTTSVADGWHTFAAEGAPDTTAEVLVRNGAAYAVEGGRLAADATWGSNAVHLVRNWVIVPSDVTLTVTSNTVVKFCEQTGVLVEKGGRFLVQGSWDASAVFTTLADDTVGGDTDGREGVASNGLYSISINSGGTFSYRGGAFRYTTVSGLVMLSLPSAWTVNEDHTKARIPVSVSGSRTAPFCVGWRTTNGSATGADDFTRTSGTLEWGGTSEGTKYIEIPIVDDGVAESNETFAVELCDVQDAGISPSAGRCVVTIQDVTPQEVPAPVVAEPAESAFVRFETRDLEDSYAAPLVTGLERVADEDGANHRVWDTTQVEDGWQEFAGEDSPTLWVVNDPAVAVAGGRLATNATWGAEAVHLVRNWVIVPSGVTLTVAAGAVVKFCDRTGILVERGGVLSCSGREDAQVVFTSVNDDTAGGDTDRADEVPVTGNYKIQVNSGGSFADSWTQMRHVDVSAVSSYGSVSIVGKVVSSKDVTKVRIPVEVSASRTTPFAVDWDTCDITATGGEDYLATSGRLYWSSASEGRKYIEIPIDRMAPRAENERFQVKLTVGNGICISPAAAVCEVQLYDTVDSFVGDVRGYAQSDWCALAPLDSEIGKGLLFTTADEPIRYSTFWHEGGEFVSLKVADASSEKDRFLVASKGPDDGTFLWNASAEEDGRYWLTHHVANAAGDTLATDTATFIVNRDIQVHRGTLAADETWGADKIHLVVATVTVPSGITLTIAPDAVVKFLSGTGIVVKSGGAGIAKGAVFTHENDDTIGGDTLFDGVGDGPKDGQYTLSGAWETDETTQRRHQDAIAVGGTISADTRWAGHQTYKVTSTVTVAAGATLTIQPGAVVKFVPGTTIKVAAGGSLAVVGTDEEEIVLTSARDGAVGQPLPGFDQAPTVFDWPEFAFAAGAEVCLDHVRIRYCGSAKGAWDLSKFGEDLVVDVRKVGANFTNSSDRVRTVTLRADENATYCGTVWGNVAVAKVGAGTLDFAKQQRNKGNMNVLEGTLRLPGRKAALTPLRLWHKKYGYDRSAMSNTNWKDMDVAEYDGMVTTNSLSMLTASGRIAAYFQKAQSRIEGWLYVSTNQVGSWVFQQRYDDYMAIALDGEWVIANPTYSSTATATWPATEGWHPFVIVCGDTSGDYGSCYWAYPIHVSINGASEVDFHESAIRFAGDDEAGILVDDPSWSGRTQTLVDGTVVPSDPDLVNELWKNNFQTHRWSFNGTLEDSVGGQTATLCGSKVPTFEEDNTVIRLSGGSNGSGWVDLGRCALSNKEPVSVEIWATHNKICNWSPIFYFGSSTQDMLAMFWTRGKNDLKEDIYLNGKSRDTNSKMGGFACGQPIHIALSLCKTGNGVLVNASKHDVVSGVSLGSYSFVADTPSVLASLNQITCWLGHSYDTVDDDAAADYNEFRIWNAALSEEQLRQNAKAGPDVVMSSRSVMRKMPSYEVAEGAVLDVNGGTLFCNDIAGAGTVQNGLLAAGGSVGSGLIRQNVSVAGSDSPWANVTCSVVVDSLYGRSEQEGTNVVYWGDAIRLVAPEPVVCGTTQYVCRGASDYQPLKTNFMMNVTGDRAVSWDVWATNYWLGVEGAGPELGSVTGDGNAWIQEGTAVTLVAKPNKGVFFMGWEGDTNGCTVATNAIEVTMAAPRAIRAVFKPLALDVTTATEAVPFTGRILLDGAVASLVCQGDGPYWLTLAEDGTLTGTPMQAGTYVFSVSVVDAEGRRTDLPLEITVRENANKPPVVLSCEPAPDQVHVAAGSDLVFTVAADDPNGDALFYEWTLDDVDQETVTTSNYVFAASFATHGTHMLQCVVTDGLWTIPVGIWRIESNCDLYVDAENGDDANTGASEKAAKRTLQGAIDAAIDGDRILVAAGTYGPVLINRLRLDIVATAGHEKTFIDGGGTSRCVFVLGDDWQTDRNAVFDGFTVRNGFVTSAGGAGCQGGTFNRCVFTGNVAAGNDCWGGAARYATLNDCLVVGNRSYGGAGAHYCTLVNCTVVSNVAYGNNAGGCDVCSVTNSIVWGNVAPNSCSNYYQGTFAYTCSAPLHSGTGNLCADPRFADAAGGDYRLRQHSPCLDAGDNAAVAGACDLSGTNRIVNGTVDLGAYEGGVYLPEPAAVTNVVAENGRRVGLVRVTWTAETFAYGYAIYRAATNDWASAAKIGSTEACFFDDATAEPEKSYWYWVAGVNPTGEGPASVSASGRCLGEMTMGETALAAGQAGVPYRAQLTVSGGSGVYRWKSGADDYDARRQASAYVPGGETTIGLVSADDAVTAYPLPFDFPFYGKTYNKVWVNSNGTLAFDEPFKGYSPSLTAFTNRVMIAPFWTDLHTGASGVCVARTENESVTFFWSGCSYHGGSGAVNVSATLFADGTVAFSYGEGNAAGAFVGISAGDGRRYAHFNWQGQALGNAEDLVFAPQTIPAGLTLSEDGVISGRPKAPGTYTFTVLATDDLGNAVARTLTLDVAVNENLRQVTFDLGDSGTRAGGGELVQYLTVGEDAEPPRVRARSGLVFDGWVGSYTNVSSNAVVAAAYRSAYVDLHVDSVDAPQKVRAGETLTVAWTVGNTGNPGFSGTMTERVLLVSATNAADVRVVKTVAFEGTVPRDGTVERAATVDVPLKGLDGTWRVRVETAVSPSMREAGGENARTAEYELDISPVPLPDLIVDGIGLSGSLVPGETVTVSFRERNGGGDGAKAPWTDVVSLESAADGTAVRLGTLSRTEDLSAGAAESVATSFVIPGQIALAGAVRVKVEADAEDEVAEVDEANAAYGTNVLSLATNLYLTAASDSVLENLAGGVRFTLRRSGPTAEPMTVTLAADVAGQVTLPETVTIPAGNGSTVFYVKPVDNVVVEGTRAVRVTATSGSCRPATVALTILDNEVPKLTLTLDKTTVREGEGKIVATVTRELVTDQPLTVYLSGVSTSRCTYPSSVVIPAGEASASFEIAVVDNDTAEITANHTLRASSTGYTSDSISYTVEDDDVPGVILTLSPAEVQEGGQIYAMLTRSDLDQIKQDVTVRLTPSLSGQLSMRETVTIPAYTMAARFAITAIDNGMVDGDREITITGAIVIKSCGCNGQPSNGDVIEADLLVIDNDGPSLSVRADPTTMKEGLDEAGWLTVSQNTVLTEDLVVRISHDGIDEIEVAGEVVIPAGKTSARIPVSTLDDGVVDGGQIVSVYADAEGYASASTWIQVSDQNLPDLAVAAVTSSASSVVAGEDFGIEFVVTNVGFNATSGGIPYEVHLVRGRNSDTTSSATLVARGTISGPLEVSNSVSQTVQITAPETVGDYRVEVILDPNDLIDELDDVNNSMWSPVVGVSVAYTATASVVRDAYMPGETVSITGLAIRADKVTFAGGVPIEVNVLSDGSLRMRKTVTTQDDGSFGVDFVPASCESGHYSVCASYPGLNASSVQGSFDILGMKRTSNSPAWEIYVGDTERRDVVLQNMSGVALTGLVVNASGVPDECDVEYFVADTLPGGGNVVLALTATAKGPSSGGTYKSFNITVTSAEGLSVSFPAYFYARVRPQDTGVVRVCPSLSLSPSRLSETMTVGVSKYVSFTVRNDGSGDSGRISTSVSNCDWLEIVGNSSITNLPPGGSAVITLLLSPHDGMILNSSYRGTVAVNCANGSGTSIPFEFIPVSESTGDVSVDVTDEYTAYIASGPHVSNATVRVINPYNNTTVAQGVTGADGLWKSGQIAAGTYTLRVSATKHSEAVQTIKIEPGKTVCEEFFLPYQAVTATYEYKEVEIADSYEITLVLDYETQVPAPVIKTSIDSELPQLQEGESFTFNVTLENQGLIAAKQVDIQFPVMDGYSFVYPSWFTDPDKPVGLSSGASLNIPITFKRNKSSGGDGDMGTPIGGGSTGGTDCAYRYTVRTMEVHDCGQYSVTNYTYSEHVRHGACPEGYTEGYNGGLPYYLSYYVGGWAGSTGFYGAPTLGTGDTGPRTTTPTTTTPTIVDPAPTPTVVQRSNCDPNNQHFANADDIILATAQEWMDVLVDNEIIGVAWSFVPFSSCIDIAGNLAVQNSAIANAFHGLPLVRGHFRGYNNRRSWGAMWFALGVDLLGCGIDLFTGGEGDKVVDLSVGAFKGMFKDGFKQGAKKLGGSISRAGGRALEKFTTKMNKDLLKVYFDVEGGISGSIADWASAAVSIFDNNAEFNHTVEERAGAHDPQRVQNSLSLESVLSTQSTKRPDEPVGLLAPGYAQSQQLIIEDLSVATYAYANLDRVVNELLLKGDDFDAAVSLGEAIQLASSSFKSLQENGEASFDSAQLSQSVTEEMAQSYVDRLNRSYRKWLNNESEDGFADVAEDEIDILTVIQSWQNIYRAQRYAEVRGYVGIFDMWDKTADSIHEVAKAGGDSVCAKITMQFSQKVSMTRQAFEGWLTVYNGHPSKPLKDMKLTVKITDEEGNVRTELFGITEKSHQVLSGENILAGGMTLDAAGEGTATILYVPTPSAAPTNSVSYYFSGELTYTDPYTEETVKIPFYPEMLTVKPCPYLHFDYFIQRDVYADDPFTADVVEASMPAEIAVLIRNVGHGDANNVTIATLQPEIFKNDKGISIDFDLKDYEPEDSMAVNGATSHLQLNDLNLGTIKAQDKATAQWWLTSSLEGHFIGASAVVSHANDWGNPDTSLIDPDVGTHMLVRSIKADGDELPDFLTASGIYGTPDHIYTSLGDVIGVRNDCSLVISGNLSGATPRITADLFSTGEGWCCASDVAAGLFRYNIDRVLRSDGSEVPLRNVWITDRTFRDGKTPLLEERLHIVDEFASSGRKSYTLVMKAKPTNVPEVSAFEGLLNNDVEYVVRDAVTVVFSKEIDASTFTTDDLVFKCQGERITDLGSVSISAVEGCSTKYVINGLASLCGVHGRYELTVQCAGIADLSGQLGSVGKSVAWTYSASDAPYIVDAEGIPVRPVRNLDSIVAVTSTAVEPESFAGARITLNGEEITSSLVVRSLDAGNTRYEIKGLESLQHEDGPYTMTIEGVDLRGLDGAVGVNTFTRSWTRDTTVPVLQSVTHEKGIGGNRIAFDFSEKIDDATLTVGNVTLKRDGQEVTLPSTTKLECVGEGSYVVTGFDSAVTDDGTYEFTVDSAGVADEAGNAAVGSLSASWTVDNTPPSRPTELSVSSDYGSIDTVVQTGEGTMTVSGVVPEAGVTMQILSKYAGGSETLLATPTVAADGSFAATLALPENGGGFSLIVRQTDAAGNSSDREIKVYYDKIALTAELSGAPAEDVVADAVTLSFSDAVVADDVSPDRFALTRDGEAVALEGVTLTAGADGRSFVLAGLAGLCATDGTYALSFDASDVRKSSSGLKASACAPLAWTYLCPDREPPTVVSVLIDGEEARGVYTNDISSVSVTFSEAVNLSGLVTDGLVGQALKVQLLDADNNVTGLVRAAAAEVTCSGTEIVWTLPEGSVGRGAARLVVDAGLVADLAGNRLAATGFAVAEGLRTFAFGSDAVASVASYAMPTWYDCDGDGFGDLVVGEKTAGGQGKVRVYRNVGTATEPVFSDFTYLQVNGSDLELAASGCQGAQVAFADVTGDGHDDLIVGHADGKVQLWPGTATAGAYGSVVELRSGSEATYGSARAYVCPYDLDGDGAAELVVGGLDGRFRMLKYASAGSSESWLTGSDGAPLKVSAGRSSPVLADVNGDGCVDILSGDTDGNVWAFLGEGAAWNATPVALYAKSRTVADRSRLGFGDVNGDGVGDLLVGRADGSVELALGVRTDSPGIGFRVRGTYTVTFDLGGFGTLTSGALTQRVVEGDAALAPEIAVNDCYVFSGWDADFASIASDLVVRAQYAHKPPVTLTVSGVLAGADGGASHANGQYDIAYGETETVTVPTAVTNAGDRIWRCAGWTGTGSIPSGGDADACTARFTNESSIAWNWEVSKWWLDLGATHGTVSVASGWHDAGESVTVIARPDAHYAFKCWTGDLEGCTLAGDSVSVLADRKRTVRAEFELVKHSVSIGGGREETDPPAGSYDYAYGSMATVTVLNAVCTAGPTQFVCTGWTATPAEPGAGVGTQAVFRVVGDATVGWTWQTNVLSLAEAVNATGLVLVAGGADGWRPEWSDESPDGRHCVRVSGLANNTNAWMQTTADGPGTVTFSWKCALASRNTKAQFFVDDVAQGVINGTTGWTDVSVTVYGEGPHVLKWRLFTGRSGAAAEDFAAIDGLSWRPSELPTLAEALNTNLFWRTSGTPTWRGRAKESRLAAREAWAIVSDLGDCQVATLETRVYGKGLLTFDWAVSCETEYDSLEVSVDGEIRTYITGDVGWTAEGFDIGSDGWHTVRWEYVKDDMDDPDLAGENWAMLDDVAWYSEDITPVETATTPVPVPNAALEGRYASYLNAARGDYEAAANMKGKNGYRIWESYVTGLDPEKPDSSFTAKVEMKDGKPIVTWEPALNGEGVREGVRRYGIEGSNDLKTWTSVPEGKEDDYKFFKVTVEMP